MATATFSPQQLRERSLWPALAAHHGRVAAMLRRQFLRDEAAALDTALENIAIARELAGWCWSLAVLEDM